ncbi:hypothetical protein FRC12_000858 [Ceratobasidium sp. 428]|nr:hypothetical protein FRC12_000858 [Ceratobasidium sp. 428]
MYHVLAYVGIVSVLAHLFERWYNRRPVLACHGAPVAQITHQTLPTEIIERVADFLFELRPPIVGRDSAALICCVKPQWSDIAGFMGASVELHTIGYVRWLTVATVKHPQDWEILSLGLHLVRWDIALGAELRCLDGVLIDTSHQTMLDKFSHLYALSIDAHSDVQHDDQNGFAYRDLLLSLPASLRRLEVTRAHGPDMKIITAVKECCPKLEELRLGRCTVFNSLTICKFWQAFPLDHDSYMSIEDTDSYALKETKLQHSLAQELTPLQALRHLRLGLYLMPSTTVLAHRIYHKRNMPAPVLIEWQHAVPLAAFSPNAILNDIAVLNLPPATTDQLSSILYQTDSYEDFGPEHICELCVENISQIGCEAETRANVILKTLLPNLTSVEWMSWLSPNHIGVNAHSL